MLDAPRAGSAEAKVVVNGTKVQVRRCTPCRQRRGKAVIPPASGGGVKMHPVQAAPRQRLRKSKWSARTRDAPRAGSAEAKM